MIDIDISIGSEWVEPADWDALTRSAVEAAIRVTPHGRFLDHPAKFSVSVKLSDDEEVHALNASYRGKEKPTNVLSFPMVQQDLLQTVENSDDGEILLGDIVLAHGVCAREAEEKGLDVPDHTRHLIVHGTLHLLGYDHEEGEAEAEAMEQLEIKALASLGVADPYSPNERTENGS